MTSPAYISNLPWQAHYGAGFLCMFILLIGYVCGCCRAKKNLYEKEEEENDPCCDWSLFFVLAGIAAMIAAVCAVNPDR